MDEFKKELEDYFCRFTFGQFVTLILIEIVTLFFVFYLGARYGPDLMGNGNAAKKDESVLPRQGPKSVDEIVGAPSVEYTYPEVLTSKDGQKAVRVKPAGVTSQEFEDQRVREEVQIPKQAPAQVPKAVEPVQKPEEKKPVVEEEKPKGKFAIQIGSYQSSEEATSSLNQWKKKGYPVFMAVGQVPDKGTWYRVRIGGFGSRDDAQKFLEKLKAKEKVSALVVLSNS